MIIPYVCLSMNKSCNDALHFPIFIYYCQVVLHEIQFRRTFELNYEYIDGRRTLGMVYRALAKCWKITIFT